MYRGRYVPWPIGARARARTREPIDHGVREWKTEIGKWKSETRSGMASIGHGKHGTY